MLRPPRYGDGDEPWRSAPYAWAEVCSLRAERDASDAEVDALRAEIAPARMILAAHVPDSDGLALAVLVERALEAVRERVRDPRWDPQPGDRMEIAYPNQPVRVFTVRERVPDDDRAWPGWLVMEGTRERHWNPHTWQTGSPGSTTWHRRKVTP